MQAFDAENCRAVAYRTDEACLGIRREHASTHRTTDTMRDRV